MKFEEIIDNLKKKIYHPVYFLMGDEPYFIDEICNTISENVLNETEKEFNQTVVYGRDTDTATVISYAKRFPMMANYQVVIVKEAQDMKNLVPDGKEKDKSVLEVYIEKPLDSTLLVICYKYKSIDRRKAFARLIEKNCVLFNSDKLFDNQLPSWIQNFLKQKNYTIRPETSLLLSEYLGSDLSKITNELNKLSINIKEGTEITTSHIEYYIGISKDFNVFELQRMLGKKDIFKSNQIINYFALNEKENPNVKTIGILFNFFFKILLFHSLDDKSKNSASAALGINPYFFAEYQTAANNYSSKKIKQIISLLRKYDMKSKGVDSTNISDGELMKELVYQILH
ncbi:MAG: DNA polymerase III subunit delta [Bacteroidota bacterium]